MEINLNLQEKIITRQTYDVLSLVGDVGGLVDGLLYVGAFLMWPYSTYKLRAYLLSSLFRR